MNMEKFLAYKTVGEKLFYLRTEVKKETQEEVQNATEKNSNKGIGAYISRKRLGDLEHGKHLNDDEIIALTKHFEISCDMLINGTESKNFNISQTTGLSDKSIQWLEKTKEEKTDMLSIINIVLGNATIAEPLFEAIRIYAMLDIPDFGKYENNSTMVGRVSAHLADEETLLRGAIVDYIHEILVEVRSKFEGTRQEQIEAKAQESIENLRLTFEEKQKKNRIRKKKRGYQDRD